MQSGDAALGQPHGGAGRIARWARVGPSRRQRILAPGRRSGDVGSGAVTSWITQNCQTVTIPTSGSSAANGGPSNQPVYDCGAATTTNT